ncbi:MAG: hypothetical protein KKI09_13835 [Spirochaetes bacterium]|nr:hypothetical protein [Spirochaetota bacterium]MBU0956507.1 hypothetical protein [Spirochaetota bacterium]
MSMFNSLYNAESRRGERTAWIFRWLMIAFLGIVAVSQILDPAQSRAGYTAMISIGTALLYNIFLSFFIARHRNPAWIPWASVSLDSLLVSSSILTTTLFMHPSGASTTAIVLIYPIVIFIAALRHNRWLILYATLVTLVGYNLVYWTTRGAIPPELLQYAPHASASGQIYKSLYIFLFGLILQVLPRTIERLLKTQQAAFDAATANYATMSATLGQDFETVNNHGTQLVGEIRRVSSALRNIVDLSGQSGKDIGEQGVVINHIVTLIQDLENFAGTMENLVENQGASIHQTTAATEEMMGNINSISKHIEDTKRGVEELVRHSEQGKDNLDAILTAVSSVAEKSQIMLDAVAVISGIAETTNLLAMNAAIEAAHAGDAGKGFSVVADEIRNLAEQTAKQSQDIAEELATAKNSIDRAVQASGSAGSSFANVLDGVQKVANHMTEIEHAMSEQAAGSSQISSTMLQMNEATAKVRDGAGVLRKKSVEMGRQTEQLTSANHSIQQAAEAVGTRIVDIDNSTKAVLQLTEENNKLLTQVHKNIDSFRIVEDA